MTAKWFTAASKNVIPDACGHYSDAVDGCLRLNCGDIGNLGN